MHVQYSHPLSPFSDADKPISIPIRDARDRKSWAATGFIRTESKSYTIYISKKEREETHLLQSHNFVVSLPVVHVHRESRRGELANAISNELITKGEKEEENKTHNCLHIPQGDAGGLISVATAKALKSLWPATCES